MRGLYIVFIITRQLVVLTRPEDVKVRFFDWEGLSMQISSELVNIPRLVQF